MSFIPLTRGPGVSTITLNRPEKLNAFFGTMREDLLAALRESQSDVVVLTGAGRAFCAGGDVEYMHSLQESGDTAAFRKLLEAGRDVVLQIASMPKPVIAAVNGVAAGAGCNLALACDYRIASENAKFSQSFVKIGLHADWGGTWFLPRLVGPGRALELLLTGRMVGPGEALELGMVDRVAVDAVAEAQALAQAIAQAPSQAVVSMKRALAASPANDLSTQLELETRHQLDCFQSREAIERIAAVVNKR
jgi:2-(1,2-epoxy-1,2-dihydrophenyl)acetyl-CoA isomerase